MVCGITCFFAIAIIASMFIMTFLTKRNAHVVEYRKSLAPELQVVYDSIVEERTNLSMTGYAIGLFFAVIFIFFTSRTRKLAVSAMVCLAVLISFIVHHMYYMMSPKSKYMVSYLQTKEEKENWLKVNRTMQFNYHLSFLLGVTGVGVLAYAFRGYCK
jgi:uncharacterized membrane protein YkgB